MAHPPGPLLPQHLRTPRIPTVPQHHLPRHHGLRKVSTYRCTSVGLHTAASPVCPASGQMSLPVCLTFSLTQSEANSHSFPASTDSTPRIYSRAALLSLARSPLSSHPVPSLASDLRSTFPEIIDERASGIARALAMGRTPVWHGNSGKSRGRRPRGAKRGNGNGGKTEKRDESLSSVGSERSRGSWRSN